MSSSEQTTMQQPPVSQSSSTELATTNSQTDGMMAAVFGSLSMKELHNFKGDKMAVYRQISLATGPRCNSFDDLKGKPIVLESWFVHRIELESREGGEIVQATRVVLIEKDGSAWAFVSDGIARDLARIIQTFGFGPYKGELKLSVEPVKTRSGFKTYTLVPA